MLLLCPPWPDRASTAWRCPDSPRPRLPPGSGTLRPGRPERPWRVWPGQPRACRPWSHAPAPPPPPGTTGSPSHAGTPEPDPPPRPTHQPPHAPPHHDAHPDQPQYQTQDTPPRVVHPPPDPTPAGGVRRRRGQEYGPHTRRMPPAGRKCPRTHRMPPATTTVTATPTWPAHHCTGPARAESLRRWRPSGCHRSPGASPLHRADAVGRLLPRIAPRWEA